MQLKRWSDIFAERGGALLLTKVKLETSTSSATKIAGTLTNSIAEKNFGKLIPASN